MEELFAIKDFFHLYNGNQILTLLLIMIVAFFPMLLVIKKVVSPAVAKIAARKNEKLAKILEHHNFVSKAVQFFLAVYLMFWGDIFHKTDMLSNAFVKISGTIMSLYVNITITRMLITLIEIFTVFNISKQTYKTIPLRLYADIIKIFIIICAVLVAVSLMLGVSLSSLFTSIGAAAALLTFVFKDMVLGILAGLQITFQNIVRVGDWVSLPSYNADGDIERITISFVMIRNFDKTITTVPTYALLSTGVKNWRGMVESGGRRIKRSINIDMNTIKILDQKKLDELKNISSMFNLSNSNKELFNAKNETTNITIFRHYIEEYLKKHQDIHDEGFTFLVRELDPSPTGLPIELYVFTKDTNWIKYETVQSGIFDHLLAILVKFDLKPFQTVVKNK